MDQHIPPLPSVRRFPAYLRYLLQNTDRKEWISTSEIARHLDLKPIQVRKDLALTGINGTPKKGYLRKELIKALENSLGWNIQKKALLVGAGALGTALIGYKGFLNQGLKIEFAFDRNPVLYNTVKHGLAIHSLEEMDLLAKKENIQIGIICVPQGEAQEVADLLISCGIRAIWNFAPEKINVPDFAIVQDEDLASSLGVLTLKLQNLLNEEEYVSTE